MAASYVLLERIELAASAASVTFANIPQSGYTDLKVVMSTRNSAGSNSWDDIYVDINGSSSNFTSRVLYGTGSAANSSSFSSSIAQVGEGNAGTANTFGSTEIYFPNYLSTTTAKSFSADSVSENNATASLAQLGAGLWNPGTQAAISSLTFRTFTSGSFVANSTFSLYGLAAVGTTPTIAPKASGGNITTDGTYWYHAFTSSGTFTPQLPLTCDYLVVAGGGGAGALGAGGAGGLRCTVGATGGGGSLESPASLTAQAYQVTVGAGGVSADATVSRTNGSDSSLGAIVSTGGGRGGGYLTNGSTGGSGGGASGGWSNQTGGSGTANQGYAGAAANVNKGGSGGGGAGGTTTTSSTINGTAGGNGVTTSISGTSTAYAGGGGGGGYNYGGLGTGAAGGTGGGGAGGDANAGSGVAGGAGGVNTGGGAGGAGAGGTTQISSFNGGSGVVIIRYLA